MKALWNVYNAAYKLPCRKLMDKQIYALWGSTKGEFFFNFYNGGVHNEGRGLKLECRVHPSPVKPENFSDLFTNRNYNAHFFIAHA